ncbi:MAG: glucose 1-dehydrogenase [Chloroflexi bacterium]|nr:glucose 1-dehydrogenase [Chloroflexota bacterium]MCL5275432.1 glucose 1-dehydrogenase [Chloroflexota bacterium]
MINFQLNDQIALVTGGGTGLGFAMSKALVEAGARVVITGRREEPLRQACAELGAAAQYIRHDVNDLATIPGLIEQIETTVGPLDILINNAGINKKQPAVETSDADLAAIVQTHLFGGYALSRECGRRMIARGRGSIIMIVSMTALFGVPNVSAYGAAKTALLGLTRLLTVEFAPHGVRVNAIAPGWIDSAMSRKSFEGDPARKQRILQRTPMGKIGEPEDVGGAAVFLCSSAASFITGVVLPVDGGISVGF